MFVRSVHLVFEPWASLFCILYLTVTECLVLYATVELCNAVFALIGLIAPNEPANLTLKTLSGKL